MLNVQVTRCTGMLWSATGWFVPKTTNKYTKGVFLHKRLTIVNSEKV